jgi:hypothetical protein
VLKAFPKPWPSTLVEVECVHAPCVSQVEKEYLELKASLNAQRLQLEVSAVLHLTTGGLL